MQARSGRPSAPTTIVDNVIPALQLTQERYLLRDIHRVVADIDSTVQWFARHGLLENSQQCCNEPMGFTSRKKNKDGKLIYPIQQTAGTYIYWWAEVDCKQTVVLEQLSVATEAIINWFNFYRDIACMYCIDHPVQIGGPGTEVEIEESKFIHRKYHRGQYREGNWGFGLVERRTINCVLIPVTDRSTQTLVPIIDAHCLPGTPIITGGWRAKNGLLNHEVVNHNVYFVDPNDTTIHTNTIEGNWGNVKTKNHNMHGTSDALWDTYLQEFCFRSVFHDNFFMNFLYWLRHYYPL